MHKMFNFNDTTGKCGDIVQHASGFLPYAHRKLGFNKPVGVNFISDLENAKDPFGKTAYYDPNKMEITLFVDKRHVKDILRSLSHELVHHTQNCRGEYDHGAETGPGYAQKDPHMRKMEAEAYLLGNGFIFRDYEDQLKDKFTMSKKKNLNESREIVFTALEDLKSWLRNLLTKKKEELDVKTQRETEEDQRKAKEEQEIRRVGRALEDPSLKTALDAAREKESYFDLEENNMLKEELIDEIAEKLFEVFKESEQVQERTKRDSPDRVAGRDTGGRRLKPLEEENLEEEELEEDVIEEAESAPCDDRGDCPEGQLCVRGQCVDAANPDPTNEHWFKGNKDQLLFERLMEKWVK